MDHLLAPLAKPKPRIPKCHPDRKYCAKGLCSPCYGKKYEEENRRRRNEYRRNLRKGKPQKQYAYSLSIDESKRHRATNQCQICGIVLTQRNKCVDHDHATKKFRGTLCKRCNSGLGMLGDCASGVSRALTYLLR
jgi:tRNA(Ile)-lysidine synthase TilS/MesJ